MLWPSAFEWDGWGAGFDVVPSFCRWLSAPHSRLDLASAYALPQPRKGLNSQNELMLLLQQFHLLLVHTLIDTSSCCDSRRRVDLR